MGIADILLIILLILFLTNCIFQAIYCRFQKYMEKKLQTKKITNNLNKIVVQQTESKNKNKIKHILGVFYWWSYHYLYGLMRYSVILVGKIPSFRIRNFFYKYIFCMNISSKSVIYGGCEFRSPWNIYMDNCVVSVGCILDGRNGIFIEDNVVLGSGVHIWTEEHNINDPLFRVLPENKGKVMIFKRAWICSDSTILPGVEIGEGVVVASRACVTKSCESYGVYAGIPAKKIGFRNKKLVYQLNGKPHWHFY